MLRSIFAAAFVVALAVAWFVITGVILNHSDDFHLSEQKVDSPFFLRSYGVSLPEPGAAFQVHGQWVYQLADEIFLGKTPLLISVPSLVAVLEKDNLIVVGLEEQVVLFNAQGEMLHSFDTKEKIIRMGWLDGTMILQTSMSFYKANDAIDQLTAYMEGIDSKHIQMIHWAVPQVLPKEEVVDVTQRFKTQGPDREQVLKDLHSGKFFGKLGVYVIDLIALGSMFLVLYSVYFLYRRKKVYRRIRVRKKKKVV
jgi:hypothetical protein